jgi:hypothetical protein
MSTVYSRFDTSEVLPCGADKIERYKWKSTGSKGVLQWVDKRKLNTDYDHYQRDVKGTADSICKHLDWMGLGCLSVARRPDGSMWVIDGNNRLHGCLRRSDVQEVPCIVFDVADIAEEAQGFLAANKHRKPVTALETFRAMETTGSTDHAMIVRLLAEFGLRVADCSDDARFVKCVSECLKVVKTYKTEEQVRYVFECVHALTHEKARWQSKHVAGASWLHSRIGLPYGVGTREFIEQCRSASIDRFNKALAMNSIDNPAAHAGKAILYAVNYNRRKNIFGAHLLGIQ